MWVMTKQDGQKNTKHTFALENMWLYRNFIQHFVEVLLQQTYYLLNEIILLG